jgi:hypothetical protein
MPECMNSHDREGLLTAPPKPLASWYAEGLSDGLGDRLLMFDNSAAPSLELLRFRRQLAQVPGFETALRDHVHRLRGFRHPAFARVRSVQRLEPDDDLALISNCTPGKRLSEVLHRAHGPAFAAALIRQLAPALVLFQQYDAGVSHGALSPDRIVVSPEGSLTIVEHVIGPAIDTLELQTAQLASIGMALPPSAAGAAPRLDVATDWYQLGLVAVSVLIGRPVTASDLPQLETLLDGQSHVPALDGSGLSLFMRQWLERALQISGTRIESGADARAALDELLRKERTGDSRRIESVRHEQAATSASSLTTGAGQLDVLTGEVAGGSPAVAEQTRQITSYCDSEPDPVELFPLEQAPVRPPTRKPSTLDVPAPGEVPHRPQAATVLKPEAFAGTKRDLAAVGAKRDPVTEKGTAPHDTPAATRTALHDPRVAARPPLHDPPVVNRTPAHDPRVVTRTAARDPRVGTRTPAYDPRAGTRTPLRDPRVATRPPLQDPPAAAQPYPGGMVRKTIRTSVIAALALIAAVEAGVIAGLARALWVAPEPAVVVETAAFGEDVQVSSRAATETAPLRLTTAPDLGWVRVTSAAPPGIFGAAGAGGHSGTIRISSPIKLKVLEGSRQLGSVPGADLKIPAGRHEIELLNPALGYRLKQSLDIQAGETVSIHIAPPHGWMTIYAVPTAEVSIDGQPVGRTPLGPLPLVPGEHEFTFRHPSGPKDRQRVMVRSEQSSRVIGILR